MRKGERKVEQNKRNWSTSLPRMDHHHTYCAPLSMTMAMTSRVRAMHHWIRKREPDKAYNAARDVFRVLCRYTEAYADPPRITGSLDQTAPPRQERE